MCKEESGKSLVLLDNSVITWAEVINAADILSPNLSANISCTVSIKFNNKKLKQ